MAGGQKMRRATSSAAGFAGDTREKLLQRATIEHLEKKSDNS
jgi:hypothetical protein